MKNNMNYECVKKISEKCVMYLYKEQGTLLFQGFHRDEGPAIEHNNGNKYWYRYGKKHREDGPAVVNVDGTTEWYLNGKEFTKDEFKKLINSNSDKKSVEINGIEYGIESELWNDY